jgi:hypothetical protein
MLTDLPTSDRDEHEPARAGRVRHGTALPARPRGSRKRPLDGNRMIAPSPPIVDPRGAQALRRWAET